MNRARGIFTQLHRPRHIGQSAVFHVKTCRITVVIVNEVRTGPTNIDLTRILLQVIWSRNDFTTTVENAFSTGFQSINFTNHARNL
mmetsp:Transcript_31404/g.100219  ORF Transcript_31404/g.100219 Transcript_31404/m.100219 type:complete len:86 (-) Transcript_31404:180-437(-)